MSAEQPKRSVWWFVLQLSEDITVDTLVMENLEHYASSAKTFQLLASDKYPTKEWVLLGTFTAGQQRGEQTFTLAEPTWARYLKVRVLSHHGTEFFCTLNAVRVYGSTMLQGFREQIDKIAEEVEQFVSSPVDDSDNSEDDRRQRMKSDGGATPFDMARRFHDAAPSDRPGATDPRWSADVVKSLRALICE